MENYIEKAYLEAKKAYKKEEVPVGAIIVNANGKIIARAHNLKEKRKSPLAHAEVLCIEKACKKISNWRLEGCTMYVTLYPCNMCLGAIKEARIDKVYYGAKDNKISQYDSDICEYLENEKCSKILKDFFEKLRNRN